MGQHQYTKLYRRLELDLMYIPAPTESTGILDWVFRTERPGSAGMVERESGTLTFSASQVSERQPRRINLPQGNRGRMFQFKLAPRTQNLEGVGALYLYSARIYWKVEHPHQDTTWEWHPIPIPGTSDVWGTQSLPIPPTPDTWQKGQLPIPPTPETWSERSLPIPPTPETWQSMRWPFRQTPLEAQWLELPVDD